MQRAWCTLSWRKTAGGDTVSWWVRIVTQVMQDRTLRKEVSMVPEVDQGDCEFRLRAYVKV